MIPVVRTRAAGIAEASIAAKIAVWAGLTEARRTAAACLEALQTRAPEAIAANIMERAIQQEAHSCGRRGQCKMLGERTTGTEGRRSSSTQLDRKQRRRHSSSVHSS